MSSLVSGPWGGALLLLFALGVPLQLAIGGLLGMRRAIPALATLALPLLLLLLGLGAGVAGLESAMAAVWNAADPAWAPWFAIQDRARAALPVALGGLGAAILALPVAVGAAAAAARGPEAVSRGRKGLIAAYGVALAVGLGAIGVAGAYLVEGARTLLLPALGGPILLGALLVASGPTHPRSFPGVVIAAGALAIGVGGLALAAYAWPASLTGEALGDYTAPFSAMDGVITATRAARAVGAFAGGLALAFVGAGFLPAVARDWRRMEPASGLDALACATLGAVVLLGAGWAGARERVLSHLAGAHAADVVKHTAGYDVPAREPIPTRVLVGEVQTPRWIMMRERGGVERLPIAGGLEIVGPAVLRNDGLMLAPTLALEDFYLSLFESEAGSVSIVGCAPVPTELAEELRRDPLLAVGRCAAFPLTLRVTQALEDPRVLIVLKDRLVDDGGEIVPIAEVKDVAGRDVIVRGQLDATVADLVAMLHVLAPADRVYLGHGVTLDGDDLPIGVDPGLRISKLPQERAAELVEAGAAPGAAGSGASGG